MPSWNDGYVTGMVYTQASYRELMPAWLATAALLLGHRPPDIAKPFRYLELGCGHGLTAIIVAATCPHAEVHAADFNPAHIESARHLASAAGLTNIHFHEASFAALEALPPSALPAFDFVVAHGIYSWISAANRAHLTRIIGQRLLPGGLAYLSYNAMTGWAPFVPLRALMRRLAATADPGIDSVAGVMDYLDILKDANPAFFAIYPAVQKRLTDMRTQESRYLLHEFLNADWHPAMFADISAEMAEAKCTFIGSATLAENIDTVALPQSMQPMVAEATDPVVKETLRDIAGVQMFRRDIYRRGLLPITGQEQQRLLGAIELVWLGRVPEDPIVLTGPLGKVQGLPEIYGPIMNLAMKGICSIDSLRQSEASGTRTLQEILQAVTLLIGTGFLHPVLPASVRAQSAATTKALNIALAGSLADGNDIRRMASSTTGAEVTLDPLEMLVIREKLQGRPMDAASLIDPVLAALTRSGRSMLADGQPVTDMARSQVLLRDAMAPIVTQRLPLMERLGVC